MPLKVSQHACQLRPVCAYTIKIEVPVKYFTRIAASGALLVVALGIVTFAQIKFAPQSADNNPVAQIFLNVESQLNG
ncbi:hypothetical protein D0B32_28505 [Paraburkholderia sp. DHOC27]|nr:hypothetical protein D0B32_28505 [Paraburkholderia sp. DHOC27]